MFAEGAHPVFRRLGRAGPDEDLAEVVEPYGCDPEATLPIIERYGLTFG